MRTRTARILLFSMIPLVFGFGMTAAASADETPAGSPQPTPPPSVAQPTLTDRLPNFPDVARALASQLTAVSSNEEALALFKQTIGPGLGLNDAATTLGAKGLTATMTKDLFIADLSQSAVQFVRGLAAWQLTQTARDNAFSTTASSREGLQQRLMAQQAWLADGTGLAPALQRLQALAQEPLSAATAHTSSEGAPSESETGDRVTATLAPIEAWALQTTHREWSRITNWKDAVRRRRGSARLCGTWQWSIHNHQNHREEKTAVIFGPPGTVSTTTPAETVVLGDSVYLRWETRAGVQEDSLLFSGEGQRLEGTFVNTAGGWGSITGKRTAGCTAPTGEKDAAKNAPRRHH